MCTDNLGISTIAGILKKHGKNERTNLESNFRVKKTEK
jgi:hypothetical protein